MSEDTKQKFYKALNTIVSTERIDNEESYIINNYVSNLEAVVKEKQQEIERLKNIIDKLEIEIEIGTGKYTYETDYTRGLSDAFIYMNDRLKELKGEDKE